MIKLGFTYISKDFTFEQKIPDSFIFKGFYTGHRMNGFKSLFKVLIKNNLKLLSAVTALTITMSF